MKSIQIGLLVATVALSLCPDAYAWNKIKKGERRKDYYGRPYSYTWTGWRWKKDPPSMKGKDKDFSGQNLSGKDFANQDLSGANFRNTNLYHTTFWRCDLRCADFRGSWSHVSIFDPDRGPDFTGSDLDGAKGVWKVRHLHYPYFTIGSL